MKRLFLASVLMVFTVAAQASGKIAVVSVQQAIMNTDAAKTKFESLKNDQDLKDTIADGTKLKEQYEKLVAKYNKDSETMSQSQRQSAQAKIKGKQADLEHIARKVQEAEKVLLQELMQDMGRNAQVAIKELINSEGIGLLLHKNPQLVIQADTSFDITAKLTDKLNKQK